MTRLPCAGPALAAQYLRLALQRRKHQSRRSHVSPGARATGPRVFDPFEDEAGRSRQFSGGHERCDETEQARARPQTEARNLHDQRTLETGLCSNE